MLGEEKMAAMRKLFAAMGVSLLASYGACAQEPSADLIAKAKAEGKLVYYTDLIIDQIVRPLVSAFEAKYNVKVEYARADSQDTIIKVLGEHKAGRMQVDVFGLTSGLQALIDAGAVRKFTPANASALPTQFKDPNHYWVSTNYYVMTPAVNTDLVAEKDRPKTYEDLLDPKWKDKMVWKPNDMSGGPGFIANALRTMGEDKGMDYLRKLSKQGIKSIGGSARAVLDQVVAGEHPLVLQIFNHHAALSAKKGAPVQWLKMEPAMVQMTLVTLTAGSKNPYAAQLFVEFMLSKEGQELFKKADYFPTRSDTQPSMPELAPSSGGFKANFITPDDIAKDYERWAKIYIELFR
jgi:ABC-type Fe3+ transport system substrate-binding protein